MTFFCANNGQFFSMQLFHDWHVCKKHTDRAMEVYISLIVNRNADYVFIFQTFVSFNAISFKNLYQVRNSLSGFN